MSPFDYSHVFRRALFGSPREEESPHDTRGALRDSALKCADAIGDPGCDPLIDQARRDILGAVKADESATRGVRVALMGRTMSGKSTLFEFLTGGDGSLMGVGAQRTTRSPLERSAVSVPGCTLVDTPGVGARDGKRDREMAFAAAQDCDLILWVFANDSTQAETANALLELADLGKPLILYMNCRERIDSDIRRRRFASDPERAYRDAEGHWARLFDVLSSIGTWPRHQLVGHALAAQYGSRHGDRALLDASNSATLLEVLKYESSVTRSAQWRLIRGADLLRNTMRDWSEILLNQSAMDAFEAKTLTKQAKELQSRLVRVLDELCQAGISESRGRIDPARGWYLRADLTGDVVEQWKDELAQLNSSVSALFDRLDGELNRALQDEVESFIDDWSVPDAGFQTKVRNEYVSGRANRLAKLAARVGPGAGALLVLAAMSNPGGWVIAGIGAATALANVLLERFALNQGGVIDRWLPGRRRKMDLMRTHLSDQTREELANYEEGIIRAWTDRIEQARAVCHKEAHALADEAVGRRNSAITKKRGAKSLIEGVSAIDQELVQGLLSTVGHPAQSRLAREVVRVPGVGSAVSFDEPLRSELQLLPANDLCENVVPIRPVGSMDSWQASAELVFGATQPPYRVVSARGSVFAVGAVSSAWSLDGVRQLAAAVGGQDVTINVGGVS